MKRAVLVIALLASACSRAEQPVDNNSAAEANAVEEVGYALRSNVEGASLVRVEELATVKPARVEVEGYCAERFTEPKSAGGKAAAAKGWRVVQEQKFGQFDAVLIVRGLDPMTSGRCQSIDANVALFEGDRLVGALYGRGKDGIAIGSMELVDDHLRIWSPGPIAQGEIVLSDNSVTFDKVAGSDAVCNGRYQVPVVFGLPYSEARSTLATAGWSARPSKEEAGPHDRTTDYRKRFPEADSCSGTGYGECAFTLTAEDGVAKLTITTLGEDEDPVVSSYGVACGGKQPG